MSLAAAAAACAAVAVVSPASAAPLPTAPVVTPSTTATIDVGTPMTMEIHPAADSGPVYGYAWTWQRGAGDPTYATLPSCGSTDAPGGLHFVCGSAMTLRVAPEDTPMSSFRVWAFDAAGDRSPATEVRVSTLAPTASLYPVSHQWTTDQFGTVPPPANCAIGAVTVRCVPDTAGVDTQHPNGAHPLLLPPGVAWDGSGNSDAGGVSGVLTFGSENTLPAGTLSAVVDPRRTFTVGAWLTPTATPSGTAATAVAQERGKTGFELGLTSDDHWQFRVHSGTTTATAVAGTTPGVGFPVFVVGVWDPVNHEIRLSVDGTMAAVSGSNPLGGAAPLGGVTVGGRWSPAGLTERWTGQVGNPVVVQAPLTPFQISLLSSEMFFPGSSSDLG